MEQPPTKKIRFEFGLPKWTSVVYRNWKGEVAKRNLFATELWYGASPFHSGEQWFLYALDGERRVWRNFALEGILVRQPDLLADDDEFARMAAKLAELEKLREPADDAIRRMPEPDREIVTQVIEGCAEITDMLSGELARMRAKLKEAEGGKA